MRVCENLNVNFFGDPPDEPTAHPPVDPSLSSMGYLQQYVVGSEQVGVEVVKKSTSKLFVKNSKKEFFQRPSG